MLSMFFGLGLGVVQTDETLGLSMFIGLGLGVMVYLSEQNMGPQLYVLHAKGNY